MLDYFYVVRSWNILSEIQHYRWYLQNLLRVDIMPSI
jgi:hypothetical protein